MSFSIYAIQNMSLNIHNKNNTDPILIAQNNTEHKALKKIRKFPYKHHSLTSATHYHGNKV